MTTHSDGALSFQITRGRTKHPTRPIKRDRFLIGSGEWCDLRLGGTMPVLHSVLRVDGSSVWLEAVVDSPSLHVNGRAVGSCELQDGDEISIGAFTMQLCDGRDLQHEALMKPIDIEELLRLDQHDTELADLSATELVELFERDEELVEEFEKRRDLGSAALLERLQHEMDAEAAQPEPEAESLQLLRELQSAVSELNSLASDLKLRSGEMTGEEFSRATTSLLDFQQDVVGRLDSVLSRIDQLDEADDDQRDAA
ncbi:MAG: hypothetical protein H8E37_11335 [Planctomycetes bacterium]|nr:hypothetical protein [Planctomycetota bacterium]